MQRVSFFFMEVCPGCDSYVKAEELNGFVVTLNMDKRYDARGWNMGYSDKEGNEALFETLERLELPDISYSLPLLFVGDEYWVGYGEIEEKLREMLEELK